MIGARFAEALSNELAAVVHALLDVPAADAPADAPIEPRWVVRYRLGGSIEGTVSVAFDTDGGGELARQIMALDTEAPEPAVAETLLELCGQALSGLAHKREFRGLRFMEPEVTEGAMPAGAVSRRLTADTRCALTFAVLADVAAAPAKQAADPPAQAAGAIAPNLDVILDIELPLTVRFGETSMTLHAMTELAAGSVVDLQRAPDAPVDVLVNGRLVARGEVVVVGGNYGVRITHVAGAGDRPRAAA